jgi:hypothetical protein
MALPLSRRRSSLSKGRHERLQLLSIIGVLTSSSIVSSDQYSIVKLAMEQIPIKSSPILTEDELQLRSNGHKSELPRQFSRLAALSFAFGITNSWIGESATFTFPLLWGGGPGVFYSVIVAGFACFFISKYLPRNSCTFRSD